MRREWLVRALRTFVQAALGFAAANAAGVVGEGAALKDALAALTVASVAAGLAALMNIRPGAAALPSSTVQYADDANDANDAQDADGSASGADAPCADTADVPSAVPDGSDEAFAAAYDLALSAGSGYAGSLYRAGGADAKGGGDGE